MAKLDQDYYAGRAEVEQRLAETSPSPKAAAAHAASAALYRARLAQMGKHCSGKPVA